MMTSTLPNTVSDFAEALNKLLEFAAEAGAPRALTGIQTGQPKWIPLRQSPLGYRQTLTLVRNGEPQVQVLEIGSS